MKVKPSDIDISGCPKKYQKVIKRQLAKSLSNNPEFDRKMAEIEISLRNLILFGRSSYGVK